MERFSPGAGGPDDIEAVVEKVKSGDKQSYAVIIRAFEHQMYTYCYYILKNREEAEDALQDIFIKVYQSITKYNRQVSFSSWLYKVAYYHCLDQLRKKSRRKKLIDDQKEMQPLDDYRQTNAERAAEELLMNLKPEERHLMLLKVVEQYSFEEIAEIMDSKPATLRKKYERIRKKLIQQKRKEGGLTHERMVRSN
ncbi:MULTISPECIES: RNA polymerase sigma factor [Paenibacillus]|uniref:ECF RNA polymerase sigma factor SigW n=1 Tax=Paenibacillus albilobatus TaxID=2716884 RepID=A0A919XGD1_9BACL|nr:MULTISPECIES: RNA polymerase sigma factor [Paenibacillus]GIO30465.1 ECF RNA polymerase sigma factor SigW [Paenibacillus albilobatus]